MRLFPRKMIGMLLLLLVFAAIAPFVLPLHKGKPLLSLGDLRLPVLPEVSLPFAQRSGDSAPVSAYKWRDAQGNWQFASEPPADIPFELIELDPDTNLIQGLKSTPQAVATDARSAREIEKTEEDEAGFSYTPEGIEKIMEKTREARDALETRNKTLQELDH